MEELIKITEHNGKKAVSARELYEFLGYNSTQWGRWYTKNIINNRFAEENEDWIVFDMMSKTQVGRPTKDFAISIDFAKKLSMIANTEKGEQARQYFIACENKLKAITNQYQIPQSYSEALMLAAQQAEKLELQEGVIKQQAPKVKYHDRVLNSEGVIATNVIAKELGTSAVTLNRRLNQLGIIYKSNGTWVLYSRFQDKGYSKTRTYTYTDSLGSETSTITTHWTQEGRKFIHEQISKYGL